MTKTLRVIIVLLLCLAYATSAKEPWYKKIFTNKKKAVTSEKPNNPTGQIKKGMNEKEVTSLLGKPNGKMESGQNKTLIFDSMKIELKDGVVTNVSATTVPKSYDAQKAKKSQFFDHDKKPKESKYHVKSADGKIVNHSRYVQKGKITVIDFYADWCKPCKIIGPILTKMCAQDSDVVLRKVNIGNWDPNTLKQYGISSIPDIRVFDKEGRLVGQPTNSAKTVEKLIKKAKK